MRYRSAKLLVLCNLHFSTLRGKCEGWIGKGRDGMQGGV